MVFENRSAAYLKYVSLGERRKSRQMTAAVEFLFGLFVEFQHIIPVDQAVDEGFEVFRAGIAVVDVVGVFPDIDAEDRRCAMNQRVFAVRGLGDFELAVLDREPGPARAELVVPAAMKSARNLS